MINARTSRHKLSSGRRAAARLGGAYGLGITYAETMLGAWEGGP